MASSLKDTVSVLYFNLEDTKKTFHLMQRRYIENNSLAIQQGKIILWTRQKVDTFIATIRFGEKSSNMSQYDVNNINGEYKLVSKCEENPSECRIVVPYEECFDIVLEMHRLFGHRGLCKRTYQYLLKKYIVDKIWLIFMARACNLCESCHRTEVHEIDSGLKEFKQCYRIFTAEMAKSPTVTVNVNTEEVLNPYSTLLIVVDKFTSFVYLKPLSEYDEYNVAMELFKIFSDYGIPKMLETSDLELFESVCKTIGTFIPNCNIPVSSIPSHHTDWSARVMAYLQDWMDINSCQNWVIGCQSVQWNMNNTVRNGRTPFVDVFKFEPIQDLIK